MLRKIVLYTSIVYIVVVIIVYKYNLEYPNLARQSFQISRWNYELNEINSDKIKFTFGISLSNESESTFFVRTIKPSYKNETINNIEYENVIIVNKEIKPKEKLEVNWDIIIKKEGIAEIEIKELKSLLTGIKVSAKISTKVGAEVITGDSVVTFYQYN